MSQNRGSPNWKNKTSHEELLELFTEIVKEKIEEKKILLTVNSLISHYKIKLDKEISGMSIRRYGVTEDGYFVKKYPEVFDYKTDSRSKRGLIIDINSFVEQFEDKFEDKYKEKLEDKNE